MAPDAHGPAQPAVQDDWADMARAAFGGSDRTYKTSSSSDSLWNSKDALDLTMPTKDPKDRRSVAVLMINGRDAADPPVPTGIRRPGYRRARTDSPGPRRSGSAPPEGRESFNIE